MYTLTILFFIFIILSTLMMAIQPNGADEVEAEQLDVDLHEIFQEQQADDYLRKKGLPPIRVVIEELRQSKPEHWL